MKTGTREFSQAASNVYCSLTASQKLDLRKRLTDDPKPLTTRNIKHEGRNIFKCMNTQVSEVIFPFC